MLLLLVKLFNYFFIKDNSVVHSEILYRVPKNYFGPQNKIKINVYVQV